uniref:Reverse transcriptase domain-containing protein n=1 Tax=Termitomyces sp. TaxID=1916073 RepID=A0A386TYB2_9AGAR|nr:hypothetical protein C0995_000022 [Termitomyces sp.]
MTRGPEHANKAQDGSSYMTLDLEQDKPSMDLPFYVNGAPENPTGCSNNAYMIGSGKTGQNFPEATPITLRPQVNINIDPKESIPCKESTTRFPKGSNSYGDGVPIVGYGHRTQPLSKVGQLNYSTGAAAVADGTVNLLKLIQLENGKFTGLYKTLATSEILIQAYHKIKSKPGNMTPGSDNETLDGFSLEIVETMVQSLKDETFQFKPVRREHIPKKNGRMRPLGVPSPRDKIVQEAMKSLLEAIYEPIFCNTSHGFRPSRGCHSALKQASTWNGFTWCIEGDIKGFFDNVDHKILETLLCRRIQDQQFIDLYWKLVKAGYVEKGVSFDSPLGVPQGGIVSPILSNIYLHELDIWMEDWIKHNSTDSAKGISKVNPIMVKYSNKLSELAVKYRLDKTPETLREIRALRTERNKIPSRIRTGVRVKYVRYADDWIVGIIGPEALAVSLKEKIASFLDQELKISLSPEKTKISHFGEEPIKFLGTYLSIPKVTHKKVVTRLTAKGKILVRANQVRMNFKLPTQEILEKLANEGFLRDYKKGGKLIPNAITKWIFLDHRSIILKYNAIANGLLNFYSFVDNLFEFHTIINFILRHSCAKTLARKLNLNGRKAVFEKFGPDLTTPAAGILKPLKFTKLESYKKTRNFQTSTKWSDPFEVLNWRLTTHSSLDEPCWICGSELNIEMHHVKHLRKGIDPKQKGFTNLMASLNRKQIPVCHPCHRKIHLGEYNGIALKDLKRPTHHTRGHKPV